MVQNQACSLPVHLRRCLLDRVTGSLTLLRQDGSVAARLRVDDGMIVGVELVSSPGADGGQSKADVRSAIEPLFELPDMPATLESIAADANQDSHLPIADVLLEGIKSAKDTQRVTSWLGDLNDALELVSNPFARFSESALGPAEGYFLSRIDRSMTVQEMLDEAGIDADLALRIVCAMRYAGVLVPVSGGKPWTGDRESYAPPSPAGPVPVPETEKHDGADADELAQAFYLVEEKLRSVQAGADHYAILEVERRASVDKIKAGYRELAKTFHPDRHAQLAAFDADIKSRLEEIFTALTNAYSVLGNAKEREAYDAKLHKTDQASGVRAPTSQPVIPTPKPPPPRPPPPAPPPPEPKPSVAKGPVKPPMPIPVVSPVPRAPKPPPSSANAPPTAPKPAEARPVEPQSRQAPPKSGPTDAPEQKPAAPKAPPAKPTVQPDALYDHGTAYAESGDWERAVQALKRGIEAAPEDARMHAKLGAALASLHGLNKLAEASLRKALELDSNSADRFVEVADVYLRFDRPEDARTLFKRAYLIDPENAAARSALDKLGVPGLSTESQPGFFKRLFRKS